MNGWTTEAISTCAKASLEAGRKTRNPKAMIVAPTLAARSPRGIDLRCSVEIIRNYLSGVPATKAYDAK